MSHHPSSRYEYYRDYALGQLNLVIGRLLPGLKVPDADLSGKTAIVTGGNSGIGHQIALELVERGATVYIACRNASKADEAVTGIRSQVTSSADRVKALSLDTSSLASVRTLAEEWIARGDGGKTIDLLFHNAGCGSAPPDQKFTSDGFPFIYSTNFLGSFLLTYLLEDCLAPDARINFTTSTGQYQGSLLPMFSLNSIKDRVEPGFHAPAGAVVDGKEPSGADFYVNTKTMQVAFAKLLQQRFDRKANEAGTKSRRILHSFTPGFTMTPIFSKVTVRSVMEDPIWWVLQVTTTLATHVAQGTATGVWLATTQDEDVVGEGKGGAYWDRMTRRVSKVDVMDWETVDRLWIRWEADAGIEWR